MNTEKLTGWILKALMAVGIIGFILFFAVGFGTPYEENPKYNAPTLTDLVMILIIVYVVIAIVATIWSAVMAMLKGNDSTVKDTGIAGSTGLISVVLFVASIVIGIIVGIINKGEHLLINGKDWNVPSEIILTDTCCVSIAILMIVTIVVLVAGMFKKKDK